MDDYWKDAASEALTMQVTDEMVERAARAFVDEIHSREGCGLAPDDEAKEAISVYWRASVRAALEAALNGEKRK